MAFKLTIQAESISGDGTNLSIKDISDWSQSLRTNYALLIYADYIAADLDIDALEVVKANPETDDTWSVILSEDGRVNITCYGWTKAVSTDSANEGDIRYITNESKVQKYTSGAWIDIPIEEQQAGAFYTSDTLNLSILVRAIEYKNLLNLRYITQVKSDLAHGAQQNELYYKRTDLDYVNSLIVGAEYNFGLQLYTIYYNIVDNLNLIVATGKIS